MSDDDDGSMYADATIITHPEGSHQGMPPPAPHGGRTVHAYSDVPPPPQLRRLLNHTGTGRTVRVGGDINNYVTDRHV